MDVDELISRGALIEQLERLATHEDDWRQSCILGIVHTIANAPAVDAVEVVRCETCRYCFDEVCLHPKNRVAMKVPDFGKHYSYMADLKVTHNHFCGYGELRADDGKRSAAD